MKGEELRRLAVALDRYETLFPPRVKALGMAGEAEALASLAYARDRVAIAMQELREQVNGYGCALGEKPDPEAPRPPIRYFGGELV